MRIIKKIKRGFTIIRNCLMLIFFPMTITDYVKEIPSWSSFFGLINLFSWFCFLLFIFGLSVNKIGLGDYDLGWVNNISKDPYIFIQNPFFGWSLIFLGIFYLIAIIKDWWDIEQMKKDLKEWIFDK